MAKTGTARLALEADCPIVSVAVLGSDKFFKQFPQRARPYYSDPAVASKRERNAAGIDGSLDVHTGASLAKGDAWRVRGSPNWL